MKVSAFLTLGALLGVAAAAPSPADAGTIAVIYSATKYWYAGVTDNQIGSCVSLGQDQCIRSVNVDPSATKWVSCKLYQNSDCTGYNSNGFKSEWPEVPANTFKSIKCSAD